LEGGFISFDQHALMISTIVAWSMLLSDHFQSLVDNSLLGTIVEILKSLSHHPHPQLAVVPFTALSVSQQVRNDLFSKRELQIAIINFNVLYLVV
jgi:hypothetical protein